MEVSPDIVAVAAKLHASFLSSSSGARRMKLRTLLDRFGYVKRSDANTGAITTALSELGVSLNPPIVRFGEDWEITTEDWIYLSDATKTPPPITSETAEEPAGWKSDPWFDKIAGSFPRSPPPPPQGGATPRMEPKRKYTFSSRPVLL